MQQHKPIRSSFGRRAIAVMLALVLALPLQVLPLCAQTQPADSTAFSMEQLDALLAPIALYPDPLLTQILMASTEPLQIVEAKRWIDDPAHSGLNGDALTQALAGQSWDPSVKSLVPFPDVLDMLNSKLDWTQQLGYAFATQQADVMNSIQRLRRQAQAAGNLQSSPQQVVANEADAITIQPANPQIVYVPAYNPSVVYGAWPYPSYPPVYLPPPPGYAVGTALAAGLAFGAGIAVTAGLWNLARPNWGYGNVNVNVNRWNTVNVNRPPLRNGTWHPPPPGRPGGWNPGRPPAGPVGRPVRQTGLPAGAIGRPSVRVPNSLVNRPPRLQGTQPALQRPGAHGTVPQRPGAGGAGTQRPAGRPLAPPQRPGGNAGGFRHPGPVSRPASPPRGSGGGVFGGMGEGRQAGQFGARGGQSRNFSPPSRPSSRPSGGGFHGGGGVRHR